MTINNKTFITLLMEIYIVIHHELHELHESLYHSIIIKFHELELHAT